MSKQHPHKDTKIPTRIEKVEIFINILPYCFNRAYVNENEPRQIEVKSPGGLRHVSFKVNQDGQFSDIWLRGQSQRVFTGQIILNGAK